MIVLWTIKKNPFLTPKYVTAKSLEITTENNKMVNNIRQWKMEFVIQNG